MRFKGATRQFVPFFHSWRKKFRPRFCRSCGQFTTWTRPGQRESTTVLTNGSPPRNPRWSHGWLSRGLRRLIRQCLNPVTKLLLSTPTSGPYVGDRFVLWSDERRCSKIRNRAASLCSMLQKQFYTSLIYEINLGYSSIYAALSLRESLFTQVWNFRGQKNALQTLMQTFDEL